MLAPMATRERRLDRGREQAERIIRTTGAEIRLARRGAGLSIRTAAASVGMSEFAFGRLERGRLQEATVSGLSIACAAVGLKFAGRAYPDGDPVRDAAHARLLQRFRAQLPAGTPWRSEVPLPIPGDRRAWEAQCWPDRVAVAVEAEMRLSDLQALDRRIALKRRDGQIDVSRSSHRSNRIRSGRALAVGSRTLAAAWQNSTREPRDGEANAVETHAGSANRARTRAPSAIDSVETACQISPCVRTRPGCSGSMRLAP